MQRLHPFIARPNRGRHRPTDAADSDDAAAADDDEKVHGQTQTLTCAPICNQALIRLVLMPLLQGVPPTPWGA